MDTVLFLILVIVLGAALPWPNSAYGRSRHHRQTDKQPPAYETKAFDHEALQKKLKAPDVRPTLEASQKATVKLCDDNSDFALKREFEERWIAEAQQEEGDDNGAGGSEKALILEAPDVEPDQRTATVANFMITFCGEYVKRYPIRGLEESVRAMRKAIDLRFPNLTAMDVRKAAALAETVARANRGQTALSAPPAKQYQAAGR
jgi:hypothetical protein